MRVHFIDLGEGAATLVELPCGTMLVDAGGEVEHGAPRLTAYLNRYFEEREDLQRTIDVLVLTHPGIDQVRGVPALLDPANGFRVRNIVDDGLGPRGLQEDAAVVVQTMLDFVEQHGEVGYRAITTDDLAPGRLASWSSILDPFPACALDGVDPSVKALWGGVRVDPRWGTNEVGAPHFANEDNHSVVVRVDYGGSSLLVSGDLGEKAIASMLIARAPADMDADVHVVGDHGARNGTTSSLLHVVTPEVAVIAPGRDHGPPRADTVRLLHHEVTGRRTAAAVQLGLAQGEFEPFTVQAAVYAKAWDGDLVLEGDAKGHWRRVERAPVEVLAPRLLDPVRITFADVGQGDAILIQHGDFDALVDAGQSSTLGDSLGEALRSVTGELELLAITHPHFDHFGGAATVLARVEVERVLTNDVGRGAARNEDELVSWTRFLDAVQAEGVSTASTSEGADLGDGAGLSIMVVQAGDRFPDTSDGGDINNDSLVLAVEFGGRRVLLTGDIENEAGAGLVSRLCGASWSSCAALHADVLKVPHHGSANYDAAFLQAVKPTWAVISAGYDTSKHHLPRLGTLEALLGLGTKVLSTSADGTEPVTLTIRPDGTMAWSRPSAPAFYWDDSTGEWVGVEVEQGG